MHVSLITINYHSTALINRLESVVQGIKDVSLVVVDNSGEFVPQYSSTEVLSAGGNIGFGRACNLAAEQSDADVLIFINPDLTLTREALLSLVDRTPGDRKSIWGPAIVNDHGMVSSLAANDSGLIRYKRISFNPEKTAGIIPTFYLSGACLAVYRSYFNELGGFDPKVFMYAEDMDLCLRAKEMGGKVYYFQNICARHKGGESSSKLSSKFLRFFRSFKGHYTVLTKRHSRWVSLANAFYLASGFRSYVR